MRYKSCLQSGGLVCPGNDPHHWRKPNPPPSASTTPTSTGHVVGVCSEKNQGWAEGGLPQVGWMYIDNTFWRSSHSMCLQDAWLQPVEKHVLGPVMSTSITSSESERSYLLCSSEHAFQALGGGGTDSSSCLQLGYVGMQFMSKATRNPNEIWSVVFWERTAALTQSGRDTE